MPLLKYDKPDLLEFFSAEPAEGEDGISYAWTLERDGLTLYFSIWPYDSDVIVQIKRTGSGTDIVDLKLLGSPEVSLVREARQFLEIAAGRPTRERYAPDPQVRFGIRLYIDPDFHLEFFQRDL